MAKLVFNSVISTTGVKYMGLNIKGFYLNTELDDLKYMWLPIELLLQEIIDEYNLQPLVYNGFVYWQINKGMYGLPQGGCIAHDLLAK
eukprot:15361728-Ditylum_brightwellii.AAC.1